MSQIVARNRLGVLERGLHTPAQLNLSGRNPPAEGEGVEMQNVDRQR